jgi:hypothetical protein
MIYPDGSQRIEVRESGSMASTPGTALSKVEVKNPHQAAEPFYLREK